MYRKLASALIIAGAMSVEHASALGLGEMTMHSALNQPLDAEIKLTNVGDLDKSQILVSLATPEEFSRAGIEYASFLSNLKFEIELNKEGNGVVRIKTRNRLNEPFLDLLIETVWPTGRVLRSYTVLVDLPVYSEAESSAVDLGAEPQKSETFPQEQEEASPPSTSIEPESIEPATMESQDVSIGKKEEQSGSAVKQARQPEPAATPSVQPSRPVAREVSATEYSGETYQVRKNDTLWEVAQKLNPSSDVSVQQMMLAIQQMNRHAFVGNNINRLKAGEVLRVPTDEMMRNISARDAIKIVAEQNNEWKQLVQIDATPSASAPLTPVSSGEEGHLTLTSAGSGSANAKNKKGRDDGALHQELNVAKENVEVLARDKKDLTKRVDSLNSQVDQLKRMVELKDAELAGLQKELSKKSAGKTEPEALSKTISEKVAEKLPEKPVEVSKLDTPVVEEKLEEAAKVPEQKEATAEKPKEEPKDEKPIAQKPKVQTPEPVEPGLFQKIQDNPIYIGVLALVIVFVGVFFGLRRKAQQDKAALESVSNFDFGDQAEEASFEHEESRSQDITDEFDAVVPNMDAVGNDDFDLATDDSEEPAPTTTMQTGNAIEEADIYIAYGRYEQAAQLLLGAIAASPNEVALRSKLLAVYLESQNKEGFQEQFVELQSRGQSEAVRQAKELLSSAENASDWLDDLPSDTGFAADELSRDEGSLDEDLDLNLDSGSDSDFDLDFGGELDEPEAGVAEASDEMEFESDVAVGKSVDEMDLADDFSFDMEDTQQETVSKGSVLDDSGEMDFDLDLSDLDSPESDLEEADAGVVRSEKADEEFGGIGDSDLSLDLDEDLSLDLSGIDETNLEETSTEQKSEAVDEDALDFEGLDLDLDTGTSPKAESFGIEEEFSLDEGLDLESEISSSEVAMEPESAEGEVDLSFDLSDEDFGIPAAEIKAEKPKPVSSAETIIRDAIDESMVESRPVAVPAPSKASVEPLESAPISRLKGEDLEFLADTDEVSTKLDLSQAYIDMGDIDGARDILMEVMKEGKEQQKAEASALLNSLE